VRLFVALELGAPARTALAAWGAEVAARDRALRPTAPAGLHLTLAFLGARPPADVAPLEEALPAAVAAGPWPDELAVGGGVWLPERRPSVLTVSVADPGDVLTALQSRVADACRQAVGWEPERRRFRPHVTVARLRRGSIPAHVRRGRAARGRPSPPRASRCSPPSWSRRAPATRCSRGRCRDSARRLAERLRASCVTMRRGAARGGSAQDAVPSDPDRIMHF
jgi:2'-5' RNA ligase